VGTRSQPATSSGSIAAVLLLQSCHQLAQAAFGAQFDLGRIILCV
jgi:hypothetical protein